MESNNQDPSEDQDLSQFLSADRQRLLLGSGCRPAAAVSASKIAHNGNKRQKTVDQSALEGQYKFDINQEQDQREKKGQKPSRFLFPSRSKDGHLTRHRFYLLVKEISIARQTSEDDVAAEVEGIFPA